MDLIDRQAAVDIVRFECGEWEGLAKTIIKRFEQLPSAQSEIIRCRDCRYKYGSACDNFAGVWVKDDDFCSRAERREVSE